MTSVLISLLLTLRGLARAVPRPNSVCNRVVSGVGILANDNVKWRRCSKAPAVVVEGSVDYHRARTETTRGGRHHDDAERSIIDSVPTASQVRRGPIAESAPLLKPLAMDGVGGFVCR
jgi:hypothetical protein